MSHYTDEQSAHSKQELAGKLIKAEKNARHKAIQERERFLGLQIRPTASIYDNAEKRDPGENNWVGLGFDIHPQVTFVSTFCLVAFILLTVMFREQANEIFSATLSFVTNTFGWFLILATNVFILAAFFFAFSRFGTIRIGGNDAKPEFSTASWYAMLLSAGMGIGLMFFGVSGGRPPIGTVNSSTQRDPGEPSASRWRKLSGPASPGTFGALPFQVR